MQRQEMMDLCQNVMDKAKQQGADNIDVVYTQSQSLSQSQRMGKLEDLERSESRALGLRVFIGQQEAGVTGSDFSRDGVDALIERAIAMAKIVPENIYGGIASTNHIMHRQAHDERHLDLYDNTILSEGQLSDLAKQAESAMRDVKGVTNSHGAGASFKSSQAVRVISNGYSNHHQSSHFSVGAAAIAGEDLNMETDGDHDGKLHFADLRDAGDIGQSAGARAVAKLNARKINTADMPVVFDKRISSSLLGHFLGAINGGSIARGASFLKDKMHQQIFASHINIIDNPHMVRGHASRLADSEGLKCDKLDLIKNGVLQHWLLSLASARQLECESNARAGGGFGVAPGATTTNCYIENGTMSYDDLIADIQSGVLVTQLMGQGVNGVTGDYSRGASGFYIENGKISYPVNEITIAGNLIDMFMDITIADDLEFKGSVNAPTIRIANMKVGGN